MPGQTESQSGMVALLAVTWIRKLPQSQYLYGLNRSQRELQEKGHSTLTDRKAKQTHLRNHSVDCRPSMRWGWWPTGYDQSESAQMLRQIDEIIRQRQLVGIPYLFCCISDAMEEGCGRGSSSTYRVLEVSVCLFFSFSGRKDNVIIPQSAGSGSFKGRKGDGPTNANLDNCGRIVKETLPPIDDAARDPSWTEGEMK